MQGQLMAHSYSDGHHRSSLLQENFDALASWGVHPLNGSSSPSPWMTAALPEPIAIILLFLLPLPATKLSPETSRTD